MILINSKFRQELLCVMADGVFGQKSELCYRRDIPTGRYTCVTPESDSVAGISSEVMLGIIGGGAADHVHPEDREIFEEAMQQLSQEASGRLTHEVRIRRTDRDEDAYIWLRHTAQVICDANGSRNIEGMVTDITQEKLIMAELRGLRLRYEHLWNQAGAAICQSFVDGSGLLTCNDKMARLLGYETAADAVKNVVPSEAYVDPECRPRLMAQLANCDVMGGIQIEFKRRDGGRIWLRTSMCRHTCGKVIDVICADITAKKVLSPSEMQVLRYLLAGLNNKEIANKLSRSLRTIENHRAAIMSKLGTRTSIELTKRVMDSDLD